MVSIKKIQEDFVSVVPFSFFNLKEGTLRINMEIEFVFVQKDQYYNAITHTLKILRYSVRNDAATLAQFPPLPLNSR